MAIADRHPSTKHFAPLFAYEHLPTHLQHVSKPFHDMYMQILNQVQDGPELSAGIRKLLEAKDCVVRQAVLDRGKP